ncbi:MAG: hypothetical protein ACKVOR_08910 [Flavobacteriales bacterium]
MTSKEKRKLEGLEFMVNMARIMNNAVRKARAENWAHGLPNSYRINGLLYFAMPDGRMLRQEEYELELKKKE